MAVRIISAVVAIPLLLFFIIVGGIPLRAAAVIISLIGMYELDRAVSGKTKPVHAVGYALLFFFSYWMYRIGISTDNYKPEYFEYIFGAVMLAVLAVMVMLVIMHDTANIHDGAVSLFSFLYVGLLLYPICEIRQVGTPYAWLPFIIAFGSDTGAYFVGSKFGKHKLAPVLSPKKSVEGAVGGVVTVMVLLALYFVLYNVLPMFNGGIPTDKIVLFVITGAAGAVFSQVGDIAASSVKRYTGIKDYGNIMPGHGGVLDRFDSVLFTIPFVYFIMKFI